MSNKERMEVVRKLLDLIDNDVNLLFIENKKREVIEIFKEQAERVQELENIFEQDHRQEVLESMYEDNEQLKRRVQELEEENKRYREAIEVAIHNMAASDNLGVKFALGILEQALEGEE